MYFLSLHQDVCSIDEARMLWTKLSSNIVRPLLRCARESFFYFIIEVSRTLSTSENIHVLLSSPPQKAPPPQKKNKIDSWAHLSIGGTDRVMALGRKDIPCDRNLNHVDILRHFRLNLIPLMCQGRTCWREHNYKETCSVKWRVRWPWREVVGGGYELRSAMLSCRTQICYMSMNIYHVPSPASLILPKNVDNNKIYSWFRRHEWQIGQRSLRYIIIRDKIDNESWNDYNILSLL